MSISVKKPWHKHLHVTISSVRRALRILTRSAVYAKVSLSIWETLLLSVILRKYKNNYYNLDRK